MKVKLHSNEPSAADATDSTLKMLPGGGDAMLARNPDGSVYFDKDGHALILTNNPAFVAFAVKNQGYVQAVIE